MTFARPDGNRYNKFVFIGLNGKRIFNMSEIKVNKNLMDKAAVILKKNNSNFHDEFTNLMKKSVKMDQVTFALEEYDTKDKCDMKLSLDDFDADLVKKMMNVLKSMDIPMNYVVNGYCRRIILAKGIPPLKINFTAYNK